MQKMLQYSNNTKIINRINTSPIQNRSLKENHFNKCKRAQHYLQNSTVSINRFAASTYNDKFFKHSNTVEDNKHNILRLTTINSRQVNKERKTQKSKYPRQKNNNWLQPRTKEYFQAKLDDEDNVKMNFSSQNLQSILRKNKMKNNRNLLGYNILYLQKKFNFSRFQLHSLYSMFQTLITDSKGSIQKFKNGFQVILNMSKIAIRAETLQKIFSEQKKIDFQNFIEMYGKIDQAIFRQNIIDYIQILFQGLYDKQKIRFDDIMRIMNNRITQKESYDIAKIIYDQSDHKQDQTIKLSEIYALCHSCESFAKKMYRLYTRECKCD